ncbi:3-dehydroquinate synthase [Candidatus Omnitrophota bacterium]
MKKVKLNLGPRSYQILIGSGVLSSLTATLNRLDLAKVAIVVTNPTVRRLYGTKVRNSLKGAVESVYFVQVPDSEKSKSIGQCIKLVETFTARDQGRGVLAVALGGGVIGDLTGFAAAIYRRGIPYIQLPTTLLAQVDSSIGGKVAIDLRSGKNLVGAFYQPRLVISDLDLLQSLGLAQVRQALAEIIKYAIIADQRFFAYLENNLKDILKLNPQKLQRIIEYCSQIKARIVAGDETDQTGQRMVLNLGHTTAHALEAACGYKKAYAHGEAVGLGILVACELAQELQLISPAAVQRISQLIARTGLPTQITGVSLKKILTAMACDKKFSKGKNRFVLPIQIGKVTIKENIPQQLISRAIQSRMR